MRKRIRKRKTISIYPQGHIFHGVTTDAPIDTSPSYLTIAFNRLVNGPQWFKGSKARLTFAGLLLQGESISAARIQTVYSHGI